MTTDVRIDKSRATDYETIFILRADIDSDASERAISRAVGAIEQSGGRLLKVESWGKRRLAFPIGKHRKGFYVYMRYLAYRGVVNELERNLRMLDTVIRYYTVKVDEDVDPTARPAAVDDETFNKAATTVPDEEALVTGAAQMPRFEEEDMENLDDEFLPALDDVDLTKVKA